MTINLTAGLQDLGIKTDRIEVKSVNMHNSLNGEWRIGVNLPITIPTRGTTTGLRISEFHAVNADITVTPAEIATQMNMLEADVKTLSLEEIQDVVTTIGLAKLLPSLGLQA